MLEPKLASLKMMGTTTWSPFPFVGAESPKTRAHPVPVVLPAGGHWNLGASMAAWALLSVGRSAWAVPAGGVPSVLLATEKGGPRVPIEIWYVTGPVLGAMGIGAPLADVPTRLAFGSVQPTGIDAPASVFHAVGSPVVVLHSKTEPRSLGFSPLPVTVTRLPPCRQVAGVMVTVAAPAVTVFGVGVQPTTGGTVVVVVVVLYGVVKRISAHAVSWVRVFPEPTASWNSIAQETPAATCACVGGQG